MTSNQSHNADSGAGQIRVWPPADCLVYDDGTACRDHLPTPIWCAACSTTGPNRAGPVMCDCHNPPGRLAAHDDYAAGCTEDCPGDCQADHQGEE